MLSSVSTHPLLDKVESSFTSTPIGLLAANLDAIFKFVPGVVPTINANALGEYEVGHHDGFVFDFTEGSPGFVEWIQFRNSLLGGQCRYRDGAVPFMHYTTPVTRSKVNWMTFGPIEEKYRSEDIQEVVGVLQDDPVTLSVAGVNGVSITQERYLYNVRVALRNSSSALVYFHHDLREVWEGILSETLYYFSEVSFARPVVLQSEGVFAFFRGRRISLGGEVNIQDALAEMKRVVETGQPPLRVASLKREWLLPDISFKE